jgi:hypothetical protein
MSVVGTYFIEIATPILFFLPVRSLRLLGFWTQASSSVIIYAMYDEYWMVFVAQIFLQVLIIITGNYNFFNLLTITLCFSLVDDAFFRNSELDIIPYSGKFSWGPIFA